MIYYYKICTHATRKRADPERRSSWAQRGKITFFQKASLLYRGTELILHMAWPPWFIKNIIYNVAGMLSWGRNLLYTLSICRLRTSRERTIFTVGRASWELDGTCPALPPDINLIILYSLTSVGPMIDRLKSATLDFAVSRSCSRTGVVGFYYPQ